jgi:hypothetical protein
MPSPLNVAFVAGPSGAWRVDSAVPVVGEALPKAERLAIFEDSKKPDVSFDNSWVLRGVTSNTRYTNRLEVNALVGSQAGLGRTEATRAALIPIRKNAAWWDLAQDERRAM